MLKATNWIAMATAAVVCCAGARASDLIVSTVGVRMIEAPNTVSGGSAPIDDDEAFCFIEQISATAARPTPVDLLEPGRFPQTATGGRLAAGTALTSVYVVMRHGTGLGVYVGEIVFGRDVAGVCADPTTVELSDGFGHPGTDYLPRFGGGGEIQYVDLEADRRTVRFRAASDDGGAVGIRVLLKAEARAGGECWRPEGEGLLDVVTDAAWFGKLYVAGGTRVVPDGDGSVEAPEFSRLVRKSGGVWEEAASFPAQSSLMALEVFDDGSGERLFVGGQFTVQTSGGVVRNVGVWDGSELRPTDETLTQPARALCVADVGGGRALFAGGDFVPAPAGESIWCVARWDGGAWRAVGDALRGSVRRLRALDLGEGERLVAMGQFAPASGVSQLGAWDGSSWTDLSAGLLGSVRDAAMFDSGTGLRLHAAGRVRIEGEPPLPPATLVRLGDSGWERVGGAPQGEGFTLHVDSSRGGGTLFLSGRFLDAEGVEPSQLWMLEGSGWRAARSGPDALAEEMFESAEFGGLALVGRFHAAGGKIAGGIATLVGCAASCAFDADGDGVIGFGDLQAVLSAFGAVGGGLAGDLNEDGCVDFLDLQCALVMFGEECL